MNKVVYQDLGYSFLADISEKEEGYLLDGYLGPFNSQRIELCPVKRYEVISKSKITIYPISILDMISENVRSPGIIYMRDLWVVMTDREFKKYLSTGVMSVFAEHSNYINYVNSYIQRIFDYL